MGRNESDMRAITVQSEITMGRFGVESVPTKKWREDLAADGRASYTHTVEGKVSVLCEDGVSRQIIHVTGRLFGNPRCSTLGGLVSAWHFRPSKGRTHAQARLTADGLSFSDASPVFTEPDIVGPDGAAFSPSHGLVLKATLTKGKTVRFTGVELAQRLHRSGPAEGTPVVGKDGTLYYEIAKFSGIEVVARELTDSALGGPVAPLSDETATLQSARPAGQRQTASASVESAPAEELML